MKKSGMITLLAFAMLLGCKSQVSQTQNDSPQLQHSTIPPREYSIAAVLWQQHSGEYRALAYQAFNLAKMQLDLLLANNKMRGKPLAIVTDIDETILDNSPYSGKQIELQEDYVPERWTEWVNEKKAKPVPGALEFFKYAKSRGVEVFYISNRTVDQEKATLENMRAVGFPYSNSEYMLLADETSRKGKRRATVEETHEIIMLIGDNLSDFSTVFENRSTVDRNTSVDSLKAVFGNRYIVLPNAIYGDWETKGILEGKYDWTKFQKDSIRKRKVISY